MPATHCFRVCGLVDEFDLLGNIGTFSVYLAKIRSEIFHMQLATNFCGAIEFDAFIFSPKNYNYTL